MANEDEAFRKKFLAGKAPWKEVLDKAKKEGSVNFYYWGGDDLLNFWIEGEVKSEMAKLGVEVVPRRLTSTKEAVDLALAEKRSGKGLGEGSVDLVWVNGENFLTLSQQDLLFGSFADMLPSSNLVDWDPAGPAGALNLRDFGLPTLKREVPWSGEQYICTANRAVLSKADTPSTFPELKNWLKKNPGKFTYVKPPHYLGATFVQETLYALAPDNAGYEPFQHSAEEIGLAELAKLMKPGMDYLKELAPLLRGGESGSPKYPEDSSALNTMLKNGEISIACQFGIYFVPVALEQGKIPKKSEAIIFPKKNMIKNKNYLAILGNAPHPAAALVFANYMTTFRAQLGKLEHVGYPPGIDAWKLTEDQRTLMEKAAPTLIGVTQKDLDDNVVPDTHSSLIPIIKEVWAEYIERGSKTPFEEIVAKSFKAHQP